MRKSKKLQLNPTLRMELKITWNRKGDALREQVMDVLQNPGVLSLFHELLSKRRITIGRRNRALIEQGIVGEVSDLPETKPSALVRKGAGGPVKGRVERWMDPVSRIHAPAYRIGRARPAATERGRKLESWKALREHFEEHEWVVIPNRFGEEFLEALKGHYDRLRQNGYFKRDLVQVYDKRTYVHNEPVMVHIHQQVAQWVSRIISQKAIPSYSLVAHYSESARLRRHVDRSECRFNISWSLDAGGSASDARWPLYIETRTGVHAVRLNAGDMVLYSGTRSPHWRNAQPKGMSSTVALFHFMTREDRDV